MPQQQNTHRLATASAGDVVELAYVVRSELIESRMLGSAVVTTPDGQIAIQLGDVHAPIYPRSALKPFQAIASLRMGAPLTEERLAIACGSHAGTLRHQDTVAQMLDDAGLSAEDLHCPQALPRSRTDVARQALDEAPLALAPSKLTHQCSGKHAGFLAAARAAGLPTETYLDADHPVQRAVTEVLETYAQTTITHTGLDGCGAPVAAMSLDSLARAYGTLGAAGSSRTAEAAAANVHHAMRDFAWAVEGDNLADTAVLEHTGLIVKTGAEGVLGIGAPDGTGVAIKMISGSPRAAHLVGLVLLSEVTDTVSIDRFAGILDVIAPKIYSRGIPAGGVQLGAPVLEVLS